MPLTRLCFTILSVLVVFCHAVPTVPHGGDVDISQKNVTDFAFWIEYASAAYCESNYIAQTGAKLNCPAGNCPQVDESDTEILHDFSNTKILHDLSNLTITDTAGFVARDSTRKAIVVSFRGAYSLRNWATSFAVPFISTDLCTGCSAELGLWTAWEVTREGILATLKKATAEYPDYELVVVGHSLGAAIATVAGADIRARGYAATLYVYGSPRVVNKELAEFITNQGNIYRFTHTKDPAPMLPPLILGYVHVSPEYYITSGNNVTVTPADIQVLEGYVNFDGNTGHPLLWDKYTDHLWYFEMAIACKGLGLPIKKL